MQIANPQRLIGGSEKARGPPRMVDPAPVPHGGVHAPSFDQSTQRNPRQHRGGLSAGLTMGVENRPLACAPTVPRLCRNANQARAAWSSFLHAIFFGHQQVAAQPRFFSQSKEFLKRRKAMIRQDVVLTPFGKKINYLVGGETLASQYVWLYPTRKPFPWAVIIGLLATGIIIAAFAFELWCVLHALGMGQ